MSKVHKQSGKHTEMLVQRHTVNWKTRGTDRLQPWSFSEMIFLICPPFFNTNPFHISVNNCHGRLVGGDTVHIRAMRACKANCFPLSVHDLKLFLLQFSDTYFLPFDLKPFLHTSWRAVEKVKAKGDSFLWTDEAKKMQSVTVVSHPCSLQKTAMAFVIEVWCNCCPKLSMSRVYTHHSNWSFFFFNTLWRHFTKYLCLCGYGFKYRLTRHRRN